MFEFDRIERLPEHETPLSTVVMVGRQAVINVGFTDTKGRRLYDDEQLIEKLSEEHTDLYFAMNSFCERECMDDVEREFFRSGFALTYAAIANEAEQNGRYVGNLHETALEALSANLARYTAEGRMYLQDSIDRLQALNTYLVAEWLHYLETHSLTWSDQLGIAFLSGGILAHDLIREMQNQETLIDAYIGDTLPETASIN